MKPTKVLTLLGWVIPSATAGYLFSKVTVSNGGQVPVAPINLLLTFLAISVILAIFAAPMFAYRKALAERVKNATAPRPKRLNPFYAVRLVVLSKATAIAGAIFAGWQLGVIWFQISSPVIPGSVWQNLAALVTSIVMIVAGLVIERICRIPEDSGDAETSAKGEALA